MPESVNSKDKRVIFPPGEQSRFLLTAKQDSGLSWLGFAKKIGVHRRTLNDWRREKYSASLKVIQKISRQTDKKIPRDVEIKDPFWYVGAAGKAGGVAVYKKYGRVGGNPEHRKKKWYEWWEREGKFKKDSIIKPCYPIKKPRKSKELAEFVGIMIGDGGITERQVRVWLNSETDKLYIIFLKDFIKKLFNVEPNINPRKDQLVVEVIISRTLLAEFCKSIGLKIGNKLKQNLDIPDWVKQKKAFKVSCIRGLVDTDGCFFNECHKIKKKMYCYPRLAFSSSSEQLRCSVVEILKELGFSPKIRTKSGRNIQLESQEDIVKYFNLIGTSNPKHKRKFKASFGGVG